MARTFKELIDIPKLQSLMDIQYAATGIPIGIIGIDGDIHVATGWQEICTKFHRVHPETARLCRESDNYISGHIHDGGPVEYRCKNGLWDIGVPICIRGRHVATLFVGQFHYEDEIPDREFFSRQAKTYGFDRQEYLAALDRLPVFSRSKMQHIMAYYSQFVDYLIEIGLNRIEREEAFKQLEKTEKNLTRSNQELERFAYIAAHDLKEPLRKMGSYMELVAERYRERLDQDAKEFIGYAVDGARRMKDMIDDLRAYSRIGTKIRPFAPIDTMKVLQEVLSDLEPAIRDSEARVTFDSLPVVTAADAQLQQLFGNLIGNALKYRGPDPPQIHVSAQRREQVWHFRVKDNGIGIEPRFFGRIFQIFQRLHGPGRFSGTGTGLALCKKIVELHGGTIGVESTPGKGSIFYFTLPHRIVLPSGETDGLS